MRVSVIGISYFVQDRSIIFPTKGEGGDYRSLRLSDTLKLNLKQKNYTREYI